MPTLNVFVKDGAGLPVANARVVIITKNASILPASRYTQSDGGCNLYYQGPSFNPPLEVDVVVDAKGYSPFCTADKPVIFGSDDIDYHVELGFSKPSRDRILNVKANLCNILDATGLPIFEPFISSLFESDRARANDWVSRLKDAGSTHITIELTGDYDEFLPWYGGRYPIIGLDYTSNIDGFKRFLDWVLGTSLIPIIKSGCDGQAYQPGGKTYGWQWGMDNMPRIYSQLTDYHDQALWSTGYDGCFPDWNPDQTIQFLKMMRSSLGESNQIDTEFGAGPTESISYCHMGNGAADWTDDKLGMLDSFSCELQTFPMNQSDIDGQIEGMKEVYDRIGPNGMYLHNNLTQLQMYETTAYWSIRKICDVSMNRETSDRAKYVGYKTFGNGLPV